MNSQNAKLPYQSPHNSSEIRLHLEDLGASNHLVVQGGGHATVGMHATIPFLTGMFLTDGSFSTIATKKVPNHLSLESHLGFTTLFITCLGHGVAHGWLTSTNFSTQTENGIPTYAGNGIGHQVNSYKLS